MTSRFKFVSTVDPNNAQPENVQPRKSFDRSSCQVKFFHILCRSIFNYFQIGFNKLTLAHTKRVEIQKRVSIDGGMNFETTTTTVMTTEKVELNNAEALPSVKASGQKPKILCDSTLTTGDTKNDNESDILTDDDTDSVGSSVDTEFIEKALDNTIAPADTNEVDEVGTDFNRMSISMMTTQPKNEKSFLEISTQFDRLTVKNEQETNTQDAHCSIVTLSSTNDDDDQDTKSGISSSSEMNEVIVLTDSDNDEKERRVSEMLQPPTASSDDFNVSAMADDLPESSAMHKVNDFFDNVPEPKNRTILSDVSVINATHQESIYVSQTIFDDTQDDSKLAFDQQSVAKVNDNGEDEALHVTDNDIRIDIPVSKSSSDQPRQLTKTQSGIKLTTTNSTPIIESTVKKSQCIPRSSSNTPRDLSALIKNNGGSIKLHTDSNGQVNISARININIHIAKIDDESSDDSRRDTKDRTTPKDTPAIDSESSENAKQSEKNVQSPPQNEVQEAEIIVKAVFDTDDVIEASNDVIEATIDDKAAERKPPTTTKTPSTANKLKQFEYATPKSMTKTSKKLIYETPKMKAPTTVENDKENLPDNLPEGFQIDKTIPVAAKDQLLLHQVYGDAWKTPEVLRSYSSIKGAPNNFQPKRLVQSAICDQKMINSRMSKGFMFCKFKKTIVFFCFFYLIRLSAVKRNIATDLDSTRFDDLSVIEGPDPAEISPLKCENEQKEKEMIKSPPKSTRKKAAKATPRAKAPQSPVQNRPKSPSAIGYTAKTRQAAIKVRQRLREICDSDSEDETRDKDYSITDDENDEWNESSSVESDSDNDQFVPSATKPKRVVGKRSKAKKTGDEIVYLDLSAERVVEVDGDKQMGNEDDLAEITRRFLDHDLSDSPKKPRKRKLFTPNNVRDYDEEETPDIELKPTRSCSSQMDRIDEEVKMKVPPIPLFKTLGHKLFDSKSFESPSKTSTKDAEFKTPIGHRITDRKCQTGEIIHSEKLFSSRLLNPNSLRFFIFICR